MKHTFIKLILSLMLTLSVFATNDSEGVYVGFGYGSTAFDDDDLGRTEAPIGMGSLDEDTDSGYVIYGGYQFNAIVALEASYRDYGKFTYKGVNNTSFKATSFGVSANLGYYFLDNQLRPFGIIGLASLSTDYDNAPFTDIDGNKGTVHMGFGIQYEPKELEGLGFRIAYEADVYNVEVTRVFSEYDYTQTLGQLYASIQYKF